MARVAAAPGDIPFLNTAPCSRTYSRMSTISSFESSASVPPAVLSCTITCMQSLADATASHGNASNATLHNPSTAPGCPGYAANAANSPAAAAAALEDAFLDAIWPRCQDPSESDSSPIVERTSISKGPSSLCDRLAASAASTGPRGYDELAAAADMLATRDARRASSRRATARQTAASPTPEHSNSRSDET